MAQQDPGVAWGAAGMLEGVDYARGARYGDHHRHRDGVF